MPSPPSSLMASSSFVPKSKISSLWTYLVSSMSPDMSSWFPMSAVTSPPTLFARTVRLASMSMINSECWPRSTTSPVCTRCVLSPAVHSIGAPSPSTTPASRRDWR